MKRIALIIAAMTSIATTNAQEKIEKKFNEMDNMSELELVKMENYKHTDDEDSIPSTFCLYKCMQTSRRKGRKLKEELKKTFSNDAANAYKLYDIKDASEKIGVPYGPNLEYDIIFGSNAANEYLMAFYYDKNNPLKRHLYALVWEESGKNMLIKRYHIYGNDPVKTKTNEIPSQNMVKIQNSDGSTIYVDKDGNITKLRGTSTPIPEIKNSIDFMQRFNALRIAYQNSIKQRTEMVIGTATALKLSELCSKHASLLTISERKACISTLEKMKTDSSDTFAQGLLEYAMDSLRATK